MADISDDVRKAAVDALYDARNQGKVMDEAAADVARAVAARVRADTANQIAQAIDDALANDELCGTWCNDRRGACQAIAAQVKRILAHEFGGSS